MMCPKGYEEVDFLASGCPISGTASCMDCDKLVDVYGDSPIAWRRPKEDSKEEKKKD